MKIKQIESLLIQLNFQENELQSKHTMFYIILSQVLSIFFLIYPQISDQFNQQNNQSLVEIPKAILESFFNQPELSENFVLMINVWILLLLVSLALKNQKQKIEQIKRFEKKQLKSLPIYLLMLTFKFLNYFLLQPFICIGSFNLRKVFSSSITNYFSLIQNLLFLIFLHLFSGAYYILNNTTLILTGKLDKKVEDDILDFLIYALRILQSYVFVFFQVQVAIHLQAIIYLGISIMRIYSVLMQLKYCNFFHVFVLLFYSSIGFVLSIHILSQNSNAFGFLFLLSPVILFCLWDSFIKQVEDIVLSNPQQISLDKLHFLVCFIFADNQFSVQKNCILNGTKFSKHLKDCVTPGCSCQNKYSTIDPLELNLIQLDINYQFQNLIVQQFRNQNLHKKSKHFYKMCHLLSALHELGYHQEIYHRIEDQKYKNQLNLVQRINWIVFTFIIKKQMFNKFAQQLETNNRECLELSARITAFLHSESYHQKIKENLINLIKLKLSILSQIFVSTNLNLFQQISNFQQECLKIEQELKNIFCQFPSSKNQSILMFFMAEVINDWYTAYEFSNLNSIENTHFQQLLSSEFNNLSSKMTYLVFIYENKKLYLQSNSKNACDIFGWDSLQFSMLKDANVLIPNCIRDTHDLDIDRFLQTGKGQFFRKKGINFCQTKSGFIQPIRFFYDIQFDQLSFFQFISFVQKLETPLGIIVVNNDGIIKGVSRDFFRMMNFTLQGIEALTIEKMLYDLPSALFFSMTQFTIDQTSKSIITFPSEEQCLNLQHQLTSQKIALCKQRQAQNLFEIMADLQIHPTYSIVRIYKIMECEQSIQTQKQIELYNSAEYPSLINDEDEVLSPYEEGQQFFSPMNESGQQQRQFFVRTTHKQNTRQICQIESHQNNSISHLIERDQQTIKMLGNVYQVEDEVDDTISFQQEGKSNPSYEELRSSFFYKKYCLYHQFSNSKQYQPTLIKSIFSAGLTIFILMIYLSLFTFCKFEELRKVNQYYEAIQINHFFIEPIHKFFLARFTAQDYFYLRYLNEITDAENQFYQNFSLHNIEREYQLMRVNIQGHFEEEKFQQYIFKKYMQIKQQIIHYNPISIQIYNITVLSAFTLLLDAFYKQEQVYISNFNVTIMGVAPHQTFQYLNYIQFVTVFDDISQQIEEQFINEMNQTKYIWVFLGFPNYLFCFLFLILSLIYLIRYQLIIDKFLNLRSYSDMLSVSKDMKRLQFLVSNLKSESEMIYKYRFNLNAKEQVILEHARSKSKVKEQELYTQRTSIKNFLGLYTLMILLSTSIIFTLTFITSSFYRQFPATITYFKLFSDVGVYVPAAFSQKEILYFWNKFQFFTDTDREQFTEQVELGIEKINKFISSDIKDNEFQFSSSFLSSFKQIGQTNLCPLLNESNYVNFEYFCKNAKNGILLRGLFPTLSDFNYQLKYELDTGLTNRTTIPMEELEAVYLCSDVISILCDQMVEDINDQTNKLDNILNYVLIVSYIFLFFAMIGLRFKMLPLLKQKLQAVCRITQIFPQDSIFLNDHFERELRKILISEQIN